MFKRAIVVLGLVLMLALCVESLASHHHGQFAPGQKRNLGSAVSPGVVSLKKSTYWPSNQRKAAKPTPKAVVAPKHSTASGVAVQISVAKVGLTSVVKNIRAQADKSAKVLSFSQILH